MVRQSSILFLLLVAEFFFPQLALSEDFRVAAYNVENYLDAPTESRPHVKTAEAKKKIREIIIAMKPDVLALEEIGTTNALLELRNSLKAEGLDFPFWEYVNGYDTNIHVAVLSRLPIVARHPHTNDSIALGGKRFTVSRGFADVDIQASTNYTFTLLAAHLKSKRPIPQADESALRLEEAKFLREHIDEHFNLNPNVNLVVLGDFNDNYNSPTLKQIIGARGSGKHHLIDTRPAERNGDNQPHPINPNLPPRDIVWTHCYGAEDAYERIDYLLLSHGMAREWITNETFIPTIPNWGVASDHRPIVATFYSENR